MCYTYDNLSRVTARTVKKLSDNSVVSTETFNYDAAGNITDAPDSCFEYGTNNRLTKFCGNDVSYDLDGNMLSNGSLTCTYDSANRLITAGGHTYTYNAEDVRIRNLCAEEDTTYTYNTNAKLSMLLTKTTNGVVTKYVYGKGLIGEEVSGTFKTYHFDYRGSTIAITNASGNITDTFAYDTYGKLISKTGTSKVIFGYNGRDGVVTDDNGLIYMRARYYSPEMKRFINADVIAGAISNAITLNRFAYANGNPVSFVDPFGLSADGRWNKDDLKYTWEELGFAYDGSVRDFKRLEQGLAPYAYEQWLKTGYDYIDDPYWDALLGNYDAIYVTDYSAFKVVGHAYLLLKTKEGSWIRTHFIGRGDNSIKAKKDAHIETRPIYASQIQSRLTEELTSIKVPYTTTKTELLFGFLPVSMEVTEFADVYTSGVQFVPLKGDFSESIQKANDYDKDDGGRYKDNYNLMSNNCGHYVQELLKDATFSDSNLEAFTETSNIMIPADLYTSLKNYTTN